MRVSLLSLSAALGAFGVLVAGGLSACSDDVGAAVDGSATGPSDALPSTNDGTAPSPSDASSATDANRPSDGSTDATSGDAADGSMQDATVADAADAAIAPMVLTSTTLTNDGRFPAAHTCNGANGSPALAWTAGPPGTQSYAIVMKDLTVPNKHWTLYDIPATTLAVGAAVPNGYGPGAPAPAGSKHGPVTFSPTTFGYLGPCPPRPGDHQYVFTVYALSGTTLAGAAQTDSPDVLEAKIVAQKVNAGAEASLRSKYMQP